MEGYELPASWERVTFADVAQARMGKTILSKELTETGIPVFSAATENEVWGYLDDDSTVFTRGTIVISARGTIGAAKLPRFDRFVSTQTTIAASPHEGIDPSYLAYHLQTAPWTEYTATTAIPMLTISNLSKLPIKVAPLPEQQRIVEKIETLFAELDKGEEALREVQKLLARYRQSVLKAAVTGTLTANWRAANGPPEESGKDLLARILKTRRETWQGRGKYKEPVEPNTDGLPELPEGWIASTTDQLAFVDTGATPKKGRSDYYEGGEIPWITSTAVNQQLIETPQDFITQLAVKETNAKVFPAGTLIVALYGEGKTRGKVSKLGIDAATNQACAGLRIGFLPPVIADYVRLFYVYNYEAIRLLSAGGVQPNLNLSIIRETLVPLPPLEEVQQIIDAVDEAMERVSHVEKLCDTELKRSVALRQSILKDAFSGKLVPQDLSDEPADELLERIRTTRIEKPAAKRRKATS